LILPISVYQVARITGVSHCALQVWLSSLTNDLARSRKYLLCSVQQKAVTIVLSAVRISFLSESHSNENFSNHELALGCGTQGFQPARQEQICGAPCSLSLVQCLPAQERGLEPLGMKHWVIDCAICKST
jgi:hypothetical protein